jgi:hypothetical protein
MHTQMHPSEIANYIGKEPAKRLLEAPMQHSETGRRQWQSISGLDLKVGGEWARNLYDKAIPNFLRGYTRKWGVKVGTTSISDDVYILNKNGKEVWAGKEADIPHGDMREGDRVIYPGTVHSIDITPEMKKSVLKGQPIAKNEPNWADGLAESLAPRAA